jgi:hypothetical protein
VGEDLWHEDVPGGVKRIGEANAPTILDLRKE